ncbi:hypothetical protein CcCBS67573_g09514 [Chytriomyces confervae]|uniref:Peptidase A1 domain-containing protein n=1 Tax=Chytriomyces confervae TaxID=246404 RepID=A0A507DTJ9_9FUNG|nr:hypothetical protein CcCBS67573_g09514 [Chytriomyces confervae]
MHTHCVFLFIFACFYASSKASLVEIESPLNVSKRDPGSVFYTLTGGPQLSGCWMMSMKVGAAQFDKIMVDTGSSDLVIPGQSVNAYSGTRYDTTGKYQYGSSVSSGYAGGASWKGGFFSDTIDIGGSRSIATFAVMYYQTPDNVVADGSWTQGILGLAYDALARAPVAPKTVFSSFVSNNVFTQDVFAFRGCPATSKSKSYLDFGATDDSLTCTSTNQPLGWVQVTSKTYYVVNVLKVGVDGGEVALPSDWQSDYDRGSIVDSCTTLLILPKGVFDAFVAAIKKSGVLAKAGMSAAFQNAFLYQYTGMSSRYFNLDFASLPKISFVLQKADGTGTVTLTMSGFNYIQGDGQGYFYFPVSRSASTSIIFGATLFQAYYIVFDRAGGRIGFGPGCDCASNDASTVAQVSVSGSGGVPKNQASAIDDSLKKSDSRPARLGQLSIAIYVTLCLV